MSDSEQKLLAEPLTVVAAKIPWGSDGFNAPAIYADVIRGTAVMGEIVKVSLVEHRVDPVSDEPRALLVATIVMPTTQIRAWGNYFTKLANQLDDQKTEVA